MSLIQSLGSGLRNLMGSMTGQGQQSAPGSGGSGPRGPRWADEYVNLVTQEFDRRQKDRLGEELRWRLNLEYLAGNQFLFINPISGALEEQPVMFDYEERKAYNQMAPIFEVRVSRLSRVRPIRRVRPASNEQRDISSAQLSSKILRWSEQEHNETELVSEEIPWMEATGTVYRLNGWSPAKGQVLGRLETADANGVSTGQVEEIREGDLDPDVVTPWEVYPENVAAPWRRQRSIIHARAYPVEQIEEMWGVKVEAEPCDSYTLQSSTGVSQIRTTTGLQYRLTVTKLENHAVVKSFMERPSRNYPQGRLIVIANRQLLHAGPLPYNVGKGNRPDIPLVPAYCIKLPARFFGISVLDRLIPVQQRYNSLRNRKAEYLKRAAIGQLVVEENSLVNMDEIEYNGLSPGQMFIKSRAAGADPHYMDFPELPTAFDTDIQQCLAEMAALSGVSDLAKMSEAPAGVKSGIALQLALDQDETRLSTTAGHIEEARIEDGKQRLRLYKQFAATPRVARIASVSEVEVIDWTGSDIRSDDVIVEGGSGLAESLPQRTQRIMELLKAGLLNDPNTGQLSREGRAKVLAMLEFGFWEGAADSDYELQASKARRQIARIKAGQLPVPAAFDDPAIHLEVLHRWMLTGEFEEMAAANQNIALAAHQFAAELQRMFQQQAMQQAMVQQVAAQQLPARQAAGAAPAAM